MVAIVHTYRFHSSILFLEEFPLLIAQHVMGIRSCLDREPLVYISWFYSIEY